MPAKHRAFYPGRHVGDILQYGGLFQLILLFLGDTSLDIFLELKVEDGVVVDGAFEGDGCAISQASADMMLELVIGRSKEEALHLADLFLKMIKGSITEEEKDELEEASVLQENIIAAAGIDTL